MRARRGATGSARPALAWAAALVLGGCGGGSDAGAEGDGSIKVGAIFDLTGPTADVGTDYAEGIRGFAEWTNRNGGIEGRPIELIFQDYAYQVDRAEQLYSQFVQEGVVVFMGWGTGDTEALRLRIAEDRIPFSSASLSHVLGDPAEAPYNFLVAASYTDQFNIVLRWILEDHRARGGTGAPVVALMHNASPFGRSPWTQGGEAYAAELGADVTLHEMPRGATDFTAELSRVAASEAGYVVFQNTSAPAAVALRDARRLGLEARFLCLNWCSNALLVRLAGGDAEGVIGAMPYAPLTADVPGAGAPRDHLAARGEAWEEKTNAYTQGWWTFAVFAEGIRRVLEEDGELTGERIRAALETLTDFDTGGAGVPITFGPEDHWGADGLRLFRVEGGVWVPHTDFLIAPR